jgi:hypothetical protein
MATYHEHTLPSTYNNTARNVGMCLIAMGLFILVALRFYSTNTMLAITQPLSTIIAIPFQLSGYLSWGVCALLSIVLLTLVKRQQWLNASTLSMLMATIYLIGTPTMAWRWAISSGTGAVGCFIYETSACQSKLQAGQNNSAQHILNSAELSTKMYEDSSNLPFSNKKDMILKSVSPAAVKLGSVPLASNVLGVFIADSQFEKRLTKKINRHNAIMSGATPIHEDIHSIVLINSPETKP